MAETKLGASMHEILVGRRKALKRLAGKLVSFMIGLLALITSGRTKDDTKSAATKV